MKPIIRIENLSKQYRIGARQAAYTTLRESLTRAMSAPLRALRRNGRAGRAVDNRIWALEDVSFDVKPGEVVGIIGRNGAGKSTLLKVLSRITTPTAGRVDLYGRVGSLLEVGTGFHAELTGRENVYLNGAILGMRRREISRRFEEIAAFSQVERFLDTPVKRYSNGMYLRLAFAVAVHLETEIVAVDEVLAVGDAQFQNKCLKKMQEIGAQGRTILFVSHNMSAVRNVCTTGVVFSQGKLVRIGDINSAVDYYLTQAVAASDPTQQIETPAFIVHRVDIISKNGPVIKPFDPVEIRVAVTAKKHNGAPGLYAKIATGDDQPIAGLDLRDFHFVPPLEIGQEAELGFFVESLPLLPGNYQLELHLKNTMTYKTEPVPRAFPFEVVEAPVYGGRKLDHSYGIVGLKAHPIIHLN